MSYIYPRFTYLLEQLENVLIFEGFWCLEKPYILGACSSYEGSADIPVHACIPEVGSGIYFTGTGIPAFTRDKSSQVTQLLISFVITVC